MGRWSTDDTEPALVEGGARTRDVGALERWSSGTLEYETIRCLRLSKAEMEQSAVEQERRAMG